jgi:hypothetical protein
MKKFVLTFVALMAMCGVAFGQVGTANINMFNAAVKADADWAFINGGITGGYALGGGVAALEGDGFVINGSVGFGYMNGLATNQAIGGALVNSGSGYFIDGPYLTIGAKVGTSASAEGGASSNLGSTVRSPVGTGAFEGGIVGLAGEMTGAGAAIGLPWYYDSNGFASAAGSQSGVGGYAGSITGGVLDLNPLNGETVAGARVGAGVDIAGQSNVYALRYGTFGPGFYTEGLETGGRVDTTVASYGTTGTMTQDPGLLAWPSAGARLSGGWEASGSLSLGAAQILSDPAIATSNADGAYFGAGPLGTNYTGHVGGVVGTSITQIPCTNTVISTSYGQVGVTSIVTTPQN